MYKKIVTHSGAVGQLYPYVGQHFAATPSEGEKYNVLTKFCRVLDDFFTEDGAM